MFARSLPQLDGKIPRVVESAHAVELLETFLKRFGPGGVCYVETILIGEHITKSV